MDPGKEVSDLESRRCHIHYLLYSITTPTASLSVSKPSAPSLDNKLESVLGPAAARSLSPSPPDPSH